MLLEWAKTKKGQTEAEKLLPQIKTSGNKMVNVDNFLQLNYTYARFKIAKKYFKGFYSETQIDNIFKVLDYFEGKIFCLNG